jgi:uridine phosphorylase
MALPPILRNKHYEQATEFTPENLLREARRQKALPAGQVPAICLLDPDGDIVRYLRATAQAHLNPAWACYHTELYIFTYNGIEFGIIGCAVGAAYAVLLAEELFVSGCQLLISVTSSGQITAQGPTPYFVLITKALRDEGTSYHYLPASDYVALNPTLLARFAQQLQNHTPPIYCGATWTTDAPFRETASAIAYAQEQAILAVEMEAAALYAFAQARQKAVICFAHVTNQMAKVEGDFEKGDDNGSRDALALIAAAAKIWQSAVPEK